MQVRRPVAVAGRRADLGDHLAARDRLPHAQRAERVLGQVPVERVERRAVVRGVAQDDERTVVLRRALFASACTTPRAARAPREPGATNRSTPRWTVRRSSVARPPDAKSGET